MIRSGRNGKRNMNGRGASDASTHRRRQSGYPKVIADILEIEDDLLLVGEAGDAHEAAKVGKEVNADVAILDVNMPGGGGWEAARMLRANNPDIRLVAYSAYEKGLVTHTMKAAGINA